jgi:hypothetical protein
MAKKIETYCSQAQSGNLLNANESTAESISGNSAGNCDAVPSIAFNRYPDNDQTESERRMQKSWD